MHLWSDTRMPRLIDTDLRTAESLTMRRIGQQCGISASALLHHFGSREHMLRVAAHRTGDEESVRLTSAWLSWVELARTQSWLEPTVTDLRHRERKALAVLLGLDAVAPMSSEYARAVLMSASCGRVVADAGAPGEGGNSEDEDRGDG